MGCTDDATVSKNRASRSTEVRANPLVSVARWQTGSPAPPCVCHCAEAVATCRQAAAFFLSAVASPAETKVSAVRTPVQDGYALNHASCYSVAWSRIRQNAGSGSPHSGECGHKQRCWRRTTVRPCSVPVSKPRPGGWCLLASGCPGDGARWGTANWQTPSRQ